jgi:hypothetical protein
MTESPALLAYIAAPIPAGPPPTIMISFMIVPPFYK